eukprot:scaffold43253_cov43-Phaeocystis_antarctica.AAC.1
MVRVGIRITASVARNPTPAGCCPSPPAPAGSGSCGSTWPGRSGLGLGSGLGLSREEAHHDRVAHHAEELGLLWQRLCNLLGARQVGRALVQPLELAEAVGGREDLPVLGEARLGLVRSAAADRGPIHLG